MAGRLSFSIAINLLTQNFKAGANYVKSAFRSMQMQVLTFAAALGAGGVGLNNLVSRFISVARETNRVTIALKNVSGSAMQYADNMRFLVDMAKKYGLEINALTGNFAKFTAAASVSNMSMVDQRKIFESVSRAVTAFGLSAEDSNGVFLALSQMMSKGKISSEELRLQMGERLPIALQAMAKAAGVSVSGLDKLLKQGRLMSADVLPKFAEALNEMIPNVDTNNLETSVNRLKNIFTELVNSLDIQGKYKAVVDWLTGALDALRGKINGVFAAVATFLGGKLVASIYGYFKQSWIYIDDTVNRVKIAEEQKLLAVKKRVQAQELYDKTLSDYETINDGKRLASAQQLSRAKIALEAAELKEKKAIDALKVASENAAAVRTSNAWGKALTSIRLGFTNMWKAIGGLLKSFAPAILISGVATLVAYFTNLRTKAKEINNIFDEYRSKMKDAANTDEIVRMQSLLNIMNDRKRKQTEINSAQEALQKILGIEGATQEEINKKVATRISLLKDAARAELAAMEIASTERRNRELASGIGISEKQLRELAKMQPGSERSSKERKDYYSKTRDILKGNGLSYNIFKQNDIDFAAKEYLQNIRKLNDANNVLASTQEAVAKLQMQKVSGTELENNENTELQKQQEKYAQSLRELNARREVEKMTIDEYNKAYADLNKDALITAMSSTDKSVTNSGFIKKLAQEYGKAMQDITVSTSSAIMESIQEELKKEELSFKVEATPVLSKRNTTFDYKKTNVDILREELDIWDEYKQKIQEAVSTGAEGLQEDLNNAIRNVDSLSDKLELAQLKQDIKDLSKELNDSIYSGIKDIASSSDRIVNAFQNLNDVMNDTDASGWERIMAVWNAMVNAIDGLMSIAKTIQTITELTNKLSKAKESEAAIDTATTATKVTNAKIGALATVAAAGAEKTAATTEVAANTAKGASSAGASAAKLPFPWNIVAIGSAIAAAIAAFAVIPKFANGGIITGGPSSGDKILVRANGGEMMLNQRQQSNLFKAINSGRLGSGNGLHSTVTTGVRAKDLILVINNELKSQGKKTIS